MAKWSWVVDPVSDNFEDKDNWSAQPPDHYMAVRNYFLVHVEDEKLLDGPVRSEVTWPTGTEYSVQEKISHSVTSTEEVQDSVAKAVTSKVSREFQNKLSTEVTAKAIGAALKAAGEFNKKSIDELTSTLSTTFTSRRTDSIQASTESLVSLKFTVPQSSDLSKATRKVITYARYRKIVVKVFLFRTESLLLRYQKPWLWPRVRESIKTVSDDPRKPLVMVTFYEREDALSYTFDEYEPQLRDPYAIRVKSFSEVCPDRRPTKAEMKLDELAKIAFPINRAEDAVRVVRKAAAKKAAMRPPVSKKAVSRRPLAKKITAKKAKTVGKKTTSYSASKKPSAKKAASRKVTMSRSKASRRR